jgi:RND family efflux transporter MFP subunit
MKKSHYLFITSLVILAAACGKKDETSDVPVAANEIPVKVVEIVSQPLGTTIQASGTFTTDDETMLAFKTGGIIEKIVVKEGDAIRKGQLLATLNLTEIEAQVSQAKLAFEKATRDFQRAENLYKDSVATLEQYQNAKTGMEVAKKQLEAAQFNRSYSEIRALSNGFILRKMANEGQVISSGTSVFQTNGASQNQWKLRVGASDREWSAVAIGDKATVTTDTQPGKEFEAVVSRKSESIDGVSGTFTIELTLKSSSNLASGLFGKATIYTSNKQNAWSIPYDALLDGDAKSGYVFTTNDSRQAHKTPVTIQRIDRDEVVIDSGLENFKFLIVSGSAYLREGSAIKVIQ